MAGNLQYTCPAVGLDFGTTGGRACFIREGRPENVYSSDKAGDVLRSDSDVNFEASVNPFTPEYSGCGIVRNTVYTLPLKFSLNIVQILELRPTETGYERDIRRDVPQVDSFFNRYDALSKEEKRSVIERLERSLIEFLERVKKQTELKAKTHSCSIERLIATIPSTWTSWMQAYYVARLKKVWGLGDDAVSIIYESEAIANLLVEEHSRFRPANSGPKIMILIDLGGHTLNINTYHFKRHHSNAHRFSVYGMENDICVHGGLELHASLVRDRILQDIESGKLNVPNGEEKQVHAKLMDNYRLDYRGKIDGKPFYIAATPMVDVHYQVKFEAAEAAKMYTRCFSKALAEIQRHLREIQQEGLTERTQVVLTGGSFRNTHLKSEVKRMIAERRFTVLNIEHSALDAKQAGNVAYGAGCALQSTISVSQFMERACFAVQCASRGKLPDSILWDNGRPKKARVLLPGTQGPKRFLTCCPVPASNNSDTIDGQSTYKVIALPQLPRAEYDIEMEYHKPGPEAKLDTIRVYCTRISSGPVAERKLRREFPIYYDCGPRVCFEDFDKNPTSPRHETMSKLSKTLELDLEEKMAAWKAEIQIPADPSDETPVLLAQQQPNTTPHPAKGNGRGGGRKRQASSALQKSISYRNCRQQQTGVSRDGQSAEAPIASTASPSVPVATAASGSTAAAEQEAGGWDDFDFPEQSARRPTAAQRPESYHSFIRIR